MAFFNMHHGAVAQLGEWLLDNKNIGIGFEWFESFCQRHGTVIEVMNHMSHSPEQEMTQDLLSIIHCFSRRLYGLRKYKKSITVMLKEVETCVP